jgi:hypothetical protein
MKYASMAHMRPRTPTRLQIALVRIAAVIGGAAIGATFLTGVAWIAVQILRFVGAEI